MRDQDKRVLVFLEIASEPFDMAGVEIVCRLVEQQDIRLLQQKLCEQDLCALPSAQVSDVRVQSDFHDAERPCDLFNFGIDHVKVMLVKKLLYRA